VFTVHLIKHYKHDKSPLHFANKSTTFTFCLIGLFWSDSRLHQWTQNKIISKTFFPANVLALYLTLLLQMTSKIRHVRWSRQCAWRV